MSNETKIREIIHPICDTYASISNSKNNSHKEKIYFINDFKEFVISLMNKESNELPFNPERQIHLYQKSKFKKLTQ